MGPLVMTSQVEQFSILALHGYNRVVLLPQLNQMKPLYRCVPVTFRHDGVEFGEGSQ